MQGKETNRVIIIISLLIMITTIIITTGGAVGWIHLSDDRYKSETSYLGSFIATSICGW
jgi:hypothetical protein